MCESLGMNVVDGLNELFGIVADDALLEGARVGNIVKQLTAVDKLTDDVGHGDLLAIFLVQSRILVEFEVLHDVFMVEGLDRLNFILQ